MSASTFIAAVDKFLLMPKRVIGADDCLSWQPGRDPGTDYLKLPLEVEGEQHGQSLFVLSYPYHYSLRFHIGIAFEPTVCRLDYHLEAIHPNDRTPSTAELPPRVKGPHYHSWEHNKQFVTSEFKLSKLQLAIPYAAARSFDSSLRWFCSENKILLPPDHKIHLPGRSKLL